MKWIVTILVVVIACIVICTVVVIVIVAAAIVVICSIGVPVALIGASPLVRILGWGILWRVRHTSWLGHALISPKLNRSWIVVLQKFPIYNDHHRLCLSLQA